MFDYQRVCSGIRTLEGPQGGAKERKLEGDGLGGLEREFKDLVQHHRAIEHTDLVSDYRRVHPPEGWSLRRN